MTGCTIGLCTIGLFIYSHTHTHTHTHTDRVHHSRGQPIRHHASVYEQDQTDSRAIAQMEVARRDRAIISRLDPLALAPAPARSVIGAGFFQHGADQPLSLCLLAHPNPLPANLTHLSFAIIYRACLWVPCPSSRILHITSRSPVRAATN
jgi:hypothetical protein